MYMKKYLALTDEFSIRWMVLALLFRVILQFDDTVWNRDAC